jgi:RimJ/RimL family protein N-acetyltransferase
VVPIVREATAADLEAIVEIYLDNARHHAAFAPDAYRVPDRAAVRDRFGRMLEAPDDEDAHFVAEVDGHVVGALDAFRRPDGSPGSMRIPSRSAEFGIGVLAAWRGRGVGSALIAAAEDWARAERLDALVLEVAEANGAAWRLYERLGYEPVSRSMAKPLDRDPAGR